VSEPPQRILYWDASAILSVLFTDKHTDAALAWSRRPDAHLLSSLAWAEVQAVIARMVRQAEITTESAESAQKTLAAGPWRQVHTAPAWDLVRPLAARWPLRGADLWHLALAKTLQAELPEIGLLTFDERLRAASATEGLAVDLAQA